MSSSNEVTYYAGATALCLPFADAARTLRYIRLLAPDFIVLTRWPTRVDAGYRDWFDVGLPDSTARLVHVVSSPDGPQVKVFSWGRGRGGPADNRIPKKHAFSAEKGSG